MQPITNPWHSTLVYKLDETVHVKFLEKLLSFLNNWYPFDRLSGRWCTNQLYYENFLFSSMKSPPLAYMRVCIVFRSRGSCFRDETSILTIWMKTKWLKLNRMIFLARFWSMKMRKWIVFRPTRNDSKNKQYNRLIRIRKIWLIYRFNSTIQRRYGCEDSC